MSMLVNQDENIKQNTQISFKENDVTITFVSFSMGNLIYVAHITPFETFFFVQNAILCSFGIQHAD